MTGGAPWSVKGIDPKAREIAKDLARRSGMTLGEWLNQVILEDGAAEAPGRPSAFAREPAAPTYARMEAPEHPGDELRRVTAALDQLSTRIEAAEHRSTQAITGVDQSVAGLLSRLDTGEREQIAVAARFEGLAEDVKADQERLGERLRRIENEAAGPRSAEALRVLEAALGKIADHVYEGEAQTGGQLESLRKELEAVAERVDKGAAGLDAAEMIEAVVSRVAERLEQAGAQTNQAIKALEASFAQLDGRLQNTESHVKAQDPEASLERIAADLSARVDAARTEMAENIKASAEGRFDRMDRALAEMDAHVQTAERRSALAIERMGHEVLRVADNLNRRVNDVDQRSVGAIEQISSEVGRIANATETRLNHIDAAGAQALEKLGGEIARITERLTERITSAERRSAQAIDDVGDQITRASERMQDRNERVSHELTERIRQSEERTARLLEEARGRIDQRLGETRRRAAEAPAATIYSDPDVAPFGQSAFSEAPLPIHPPPETAPVEPTPTDVGPFDDDVFHGPESEAARLADEAEGDLLTPRDFAADNLVEPASFTSSALFTRPGAFDFHPAGAAETHDDPFGLSESHESDDESDGFITVAPSHAEAKDEDWGEVLAPPAAPSTPLDAYDEGLFVRPSSTRELIEQARAAARASSQEAAAGKKSRVRDTSSSLFSGFGLSRPKKVKRSATLRTMLLLSGVVAAAGVSTAGYVLLTDKPGGAPPQRVADGQSPSPALSDGETHPLAAVALNPTPVSASTGLAAPSAAAAANAAALYEDGSRRIEAQDFTGVEALRKAANLGYAPAEFYLAKLYEDGQAGLRKDLGEARVWTQRAADAGDRKAMHNLALYYFEGAGGTKDMASAAAWFRKAADLGLVDSQYNLARLYEKGFGVGQNPAEAYKWYLIAARSGDADSRQSALQIKGQISPQAQAAAERAAESFQPQGPDAANLTAGLDLTPQLAQATGAVDGDVASLQRALSRLGYFQGPTDGVSSPALKLAIAAYQRDQGLPGTGALDPSSQQLLYAAAQ